MMEVVYDINETFVEKILTTRMLSKAFWVRCVKT